MMRYITSLCLIVAALGLPAVASPMPNGGASCSKGGTFQMTGSSLPSTTAASSQPQSLSHVTITLPASTPVGGRLARVTAYWPSEGDYYTRHSLAATGVRLHDGHCAVDPNIIPYGSVVAIAGIGTFLAVDTGTAVVERTAAREGGRTYAQRHALVVDLFFESRRKGEAFASSAARWAAISWWTPGSSSSSAKEARSLFADEDWQKIESKQL